MLRNDWNQQVSLRDNIDAVSLNEGRSNRALFAVC